MLTRSRYGIATTFALAGVLNAAWTVRIPALTDKLHLNAAALGTAVLCVGVGATLAMQCSRIIIARTGSRSMVMVAGPASAVLLAGLGLAPSYRWLLVAALAYGLAFGLLDMAMNAQAAVLERTAGRHLMNGMHAGWSIGSVVGGGFGALTAYVGMTFTQAVLGAAAICLPIALLLLFTYLPDPPTPVAQRRSAARISPLIYLVGAIALASFLIEGAVSSWSGLYVRDALRASDTVAALAYPTFEGGMIVGRMLGDGIRRSIGARVMLIAAGVVAAAGFVIAISASAWWLALVGFFVVGLASSTVVPLAFSMAGGLAPSGAGIAQVGAMGYGGMLVGPVLIGYVAQATSLRAGLLSVVGLALIMSVLGWLVPARIAEPAAADVLPPEA
jgi:MFS family permease